MRKLGLISFFTLLAAMFAFLMANKNETVLQSGEYGVIEISGGKKVVIDGDVKIQNINVNGEGSLHVNSGSILKLSGSLHQNGKFNIYNNGTIIAGNFEAQNGNNYFLNNGYFSGKIGQITDCSSIIENNGHIVFESFQANCGKIIIGECGKFETGHLDVNQKEIFAGIGFLLVKNSINANAKIGKEGLRFYYKQNIPYDKISGLILVSIDYTCKPLPVVWQSVSFTQKDVYFEVTNPEQIDHILIETSEDGINWKTIKTQKNISNKNKIDL